MPHKRLTYAQRSILRTKLRQKRACYASEYGSVCAVQIKDQLLGSGLVHGDSHLFLYYPHASELSLHTFIEAAWQSLACKLYLPKLPLSGKIMEFGLYTPETVLKPNRFGILEPTSASVQWNALPDHARKVVLVPLLAIDQLGHRLGMGQGYYDHTLAYLKTVTAITSLGVGFNWQFFQHVRLEPHAYDVPLEGILLPKGLQWLPPKQN